MSFPSYEEKNIDSNITIETSNEYHDDFKNVLDAWSNDQQNDAYFKALIPLVCQFLISDQNIWINFAEPEKSINILNAKEIDKSFEVEYDLRDYLNFKDNVHTLTIKS